MSRSPFPVAMDLTSVSLAFENKRFIADEALPRFPVDSINYSYAVYNFDEGFAVQDTAVGRRSAPNQVEFHAKDVTSKTVDHALDDSVPEYDRHTTRQPNGRLHARIAERVTNLIALNREKRVADLLFNEAIYPDDNKIVLSGSDSWSDSANSDPVATISAALDTPIMRPNTGVIGRKLYSVLSQHPDIMKSVNATSGDKGIATRQAIANLFELDNLWVGEGFYIERLRNEDAAQTPLRLWGASMALYYLDQLGGPDEMPSFGFTAEYEKRMVSKYFDEKVGARGGTIIRVAESVDEQICAPRLGYLIEDAVVAAQ